MSDFKVYIQECDKNGGSGTNTKDIEKDFNVTGGKLLYKECKGLNDVGKVMNVYTETYHDSNKIRVHVPEKVFHEPTTITLTLLFVGDERAKVKDSFDNFIIQGFHKYWDTVRKKAFVFYIADEIPVGEEMSKGSEKYMVCSYKLKNIQGKTTDV